MTTSHSRPSPLDFSQLDAYQEAAHSTAVYHPAMAFHYPQSLLSEEVGEVLGVFNKASRAGVPVDVEKLCDELGDALWALAETASANGLKLSEIARHNIQKLGARRENGTLARGL